MVRRVLMECVLHSAEAHCRRTGKNEPFDTTIRLYMSIDTMAPSVHRPASLHYSEMGGVGTSQLDADNTDGLGSWLDQNTGATVELRDRLHEIAKGFYDYVELHARRAANDLNVSIKSEPGMGQELRDKLSTFELGFDELDRKIQIIESPSYSAVEL